MKRRSLRITTLVALAVCVLCACASSPPSDGASSAAEVKIYESAQLAQNQYQLLRYLPVDSWRTAFWLPTYASQAEGLASLQAEAARLGADGLIDVSCRDQGSFTGFTSGKPAFLCYGNAIRVGRNAQ
ncbi:MAG: hypothetical protein IH606_03030 [Burkholderiales bacterium]|nr:hypothetical protein [Burkholderiales bacterium]